MTADPLFTVNGLHKSFGALKVCSNLSLELQRGELHALIGPNGAGKTTALDLFTGLLQADSGTITFDGRDITSLSVHRRARLGLARAFQVTSVFDSFTVEENVAIAVQARLPADYRFWKNAARDRSLTSPAGSVLGRMGLSDRSHVPAARLSHGERRQLEMAMALATEPAMLLLDEPMAGLGPGGTRKLAELIGSIKGEITILLVEHDMQAVFSLADRITVLVQGSVEACGDCEQIRNNPVVQAAYLGAG